MRKQLKSKRRSRRDTSPVTLRDLLAVLGRIADTLDTIESTLYSIKLEQS